MKQMKLSLRLAALVTALMMLLTIVPALAEEIASDVPAEETAVEMIDQELAILDGVPIFQSQCEQLINYYSSSYNLTYADAVDNFLFSLALDKLADELGFSTFTQEEIDEFTTTAQEQWDEVIQTYVEYYLTEDTEEARAALKSQGEQYYASYGLSVQSLVESLKNSAKYERFEAYLMDGKEISEEDIQAQFDAAVENQKSMIDGNAMMYEMYNYYYGDMWYIPSGYRAVLHILLKPDDELLTAYQDAEEEYQNKLTAMQSQEDAAVTPEATEVPSEETEPETPVTQADVDAAKAAMDAARDAIFASKQDAIDDINARLDAGEDFTALVAEYNEDPGLDITTGYNVHPESILWDPIFRDAAFSDKMQKIGDHSDPVLGSNGIHILYYLNDVAEGAVPMTDEIHDTIKNSLYQNILYAAQDQAYQERIAQSIVVRNNDLINALDGVEEDTDTSIQGDDAQE